jgi:hypothetical protein
MKGCYKKQTPTSLSHIPMIKIKFEIISILLRQKTRYEKKIYKFFLHNITLLKAFGKVRNESELNS